MRQLPEPSVADIRLTEVLRALSDPIRLVLAAKLAAVEELRCTEAGMDLEIHKSTLSYHYRTLREAGVMRTYAVGRERHLRLRRQDLDLRFPGLLDAILAAARNSR
ncbi:ArsR/SmtB family transcription factor [Nonomuraea longicatena]|uniref:Helix-turn-helix transcriptional regulator n=1 Tax=Nonomuraea longicatena TaxID=83682 RepID=C9W335_9ACTN|nr:putative ArsR family transcriptional regulator [Nonomuraea longicatena]